LAAARLDSSRRHLWRWLSFVTNIIPWQGHVNSPVAGVFLRLLPVERRILWQGKKRTRLADPCVREGEALARLKSALGDCQTWGVEVSYSRIQKAQRVIDVVLPTSFYHVKWADRTASLCLANPPYDFSPYLDERGKHIRHERLFDMQMTRRLVTGGLHLIIIPHQHPTRIQIEGLITWGNPDANLTELCPGDGRYVLPPAPTVSADAFLYTPFTHEEQIRAAQKCSPFKTGDLSYFTNYYFRLPNSGTMWMPDARRRRRASSNCWRCYSS